MLKIGEFSKIGRVTKRTLRHYDEIGLLSPIFIDDMSGYRKYSIDQLAKLNRIVLLKDLGFSLKEVRRMLDEDIPIDQMREMFSKKQKDLENEIYLSQKNLKMIKNRLAAIENEGRVPDYDIILKETDAFTMASHRMLVPHMNQMGVYCHGMYERLYKELRRLSVTPIGPEITFYYNEEYTETDIDMETGIVISKENEDAFQDVASRLEFTTVEAEEHVASTIYTGPYHESGEAVIELLKWIGTNNWQSIGALREVHLSGPAHPDGEVAKNAILEFQMPVTREQRR